MPTKKQHYVPRVYLKAWETQVETTHEPNKKFQGVYVFEDGGTVGEGANRDSILWKPHLYTISFRQLYMAKKCPQVYSHFVDAIYDTMRNNSPQAVYGRYGYSVIRTKASVRKHLLEINEWDFYYDNGDVARKKGILNRINDFHCYILEDSFDVFFETKWERIKTKFIEDVRNGLPVTLADSARKIPEASAKRMLEFLFMLQCRSPKYDAMGLYPWMEDVLTQTFGDAAEIKELIDAVWYTELYRILYQTSGGVYHTLLDQVFEKCQMILFEANNNAEFFITSDNPAFRNYNLVEIKNSNGYIFPLGPKHLLFIGKGDDDISVVDYRTANEETVRFFNRIIRQNSNGIIVGTRKNLNALI